MTLANTLRASIIALTCGAALIATVPAEAHIGGGGFHGGGFHGGGFHNGGFRDRGFHRSGFRFRDHRGFGFGGYYGRDWCFYHPYSCGY